MFYLNKNIEKLDRIFDQNKREGFLRLDLNENPTGLPEEFIADVLKDITPEFISQYPETLDFTETLAKYLHTDIGHLNLVNGSSEGIRNIIEAYTSVGGKILGVTPSYAMFEVYSKMYGRTFIPVEYTDDLKLPIERILDKMTKDIELLIIVNPNNPVGNAYTNEEMQRIVDKAKENEITILIDEAYFYFYDNTFINFALENEHIFVTRTFSKLFSLAGCRLGYVVGWPEGIKMIQKLCTPHNVNAFSMKFAKALIEEPNMIETLINKHKEGREYLIEFLNKNDYEFSALNGNFMFIKPKTDADVLVKRMKEEEKILIKTYNGIGKLGKCLRVTTGEKKAMIKFINAMLKLDK
jgi:histidinol-phosphate aminotransferase